MLYPEELCKADENQPAEEDEEEEEEEEVGINVGEMLDQPMNAGEVLSTHHIVYGEDGQVILCNIALHFSCSQKDSIQEKSKKWQSMLVFPEIAEIGTHKKAK